MDDPTDTAFKNQLDDWATLHPMTRDSIRQRPPWCTCDVGTTANLYRMVWLCAYHAGMDHGAVYGARFDVDNLPPWSWDYPATEPYHGVQDRDVRPVPYVNGVTVRTVRVVGGPHDGLVVEGTPVDDRVVQPSVMWRFDAVTIWTPLALDEDDLLFTSWTDDLDAARSIQLSNAGA